ncbi:hypothetical protein FH972_018237 [Carpinus fangiana]|uniref:Uncharacterized protein n=1 Tax=Carpinus fangiana TaxID=176857 RepID=A0A5N6RQD6_9ROSI|nr:hypothetical protein FH972_018237 [Carpinus fangiana]
MSSFGVVASPLPPQLAACSAPRNPLTGFRQLLPSLTGNEARGLKSVENAHDDSIWAATWVPATETRSALLLTESLNEIVRLWSSDELVLERTNTGHCLGMVSVAAHPSGHIAASASLDMGRVVRLLNRRERRRR